MRKIIVILLLYFFLGSNISLLAEDKETKSNISVDVKKYSIDVIVKNIPQDQQTLFIPIKIDTMILDFDKVSLDGLSSQNILAVTSSSKDKVGTGIGLLKLDDKGLPESINLKVYLKPIGDGQTAINLVKVAKGPALPIKGALLYEEVSASISTGNEIEITEKTENNKKKLALNSSKLIIDVKRPSQKEESIFIPVIFDKSIVDLDETFGHAIIAPGIAAKSYSSASLHEGGSGVEILLSDVADKDFTIDVDLIPRKIGKSKIELAYPQKGHTAIVTGPSVDISPATLSVSRSTVFLDGQ